ncbi:MAG: single-strand DNA-binding protein [Parcubacteria group bacterium Greene0714_36]|nr:MAG: single-strand DNA-binding protein [Parcubacteria group bacterium Greene0714_36]
MNLNKVFILGNLTRDPELRQTPSGAAVCSFGVATNRRYTDKQGQKQEQVEFHSIVAWGRQAEIITQYLHKGSSILVEGRLQTRSWQDPQGAKHYKTEVIADQIQLGPKSQSRGDGSASSGGSASRQQTGNGGWDDSGARAPQPQSAPVGSDASNAMPIIELPEEGEEIDIKDIPF